jgi:pyruvate ferredoxin oxidoreductase beta subunit
LFPLFEAEHGEITTSTKIRHKVQVEEYLKVQRRFAHVLKNPDQLQKIRNIADNNIKKFGLMSSTGGEE